MRSAERTQTPTKNAVFALLQKVILENTNYAPHASKLSIAVPTARNMTGKRNTRPNARNYRRKSKSEVAK